MSGGPDFQRPLPLKIAASCCSVWGVLPRAAARVASCSGRLADHGCVGACAGTGVQPAHRAGGFPGTAFGVEGDRAFEDGFVGRLAGPAIGGEHGGFEFIVQRFQYCNETFFVDGLSRGRKRRITSADFWSAIHHLDTPA